MKARMAASSRHTVAGPESAIGIAEDRNRDASSRPLGLPRRAKGLKKELRHVAPTPNPKPRDGHEGHQNAAAGASWQKLVRFQQPDQFRGPLPSLRHLSGVPEGEGLR
jgi:hypothetical protein